MNTLFLYNTKTLKSQINTKIFAGDNLITKINVQLPDNIGGYPKRECEFNLRAIIPEGNLSYIINPNEPYFYITNDITEKAQTVKLMMIITHEGNVIGRTNTVDLIVNEPAEAPDPPLTPRALADKVINEQRAEIAEQAETISEQATAIETKDGQISELNDEITEKDGQITELTNENTRLETLTDTQNDTIQYMIEHPPQPRLETPDIIVPEVETRQYTPSTGYDGFASFTVKGNKYLNVDLQKFLARDIDFDLEIQADIIGNYLCYGQRGLINCRLTGSPIRTGAYAFQDCSSLQTINLPSSLTSIGDGAFQNCSSLRTINLPSGVISIEQKAFQGCSSLQTMTLPDSLTRIGNGAFQNCASLTELTLPDSLTSIGNGAFQNCASLTNLTLAQGFNCNGLNVSWSARFTAETIVACLEALADRTGLTAYTITFGTTNINKLTAEQKSIATNKNWNLA